MVNRHGNKIRVFAPVDLDGALPRTQPGEAKLGVTAVQKDGKSRYVRLDLDKETLLVGPYGCVEHAERASSLIAALLQVRWQQEPERVEPIEDSGVRVLH